MSWRVKRSGELMWHGEAIGQLHKYPLSTKQGGTEWRFRPYKGLYQKMVGLTQPISCKLRNDVIEKIRQIIRSKEKQLGEEH